MGWSSLSFPFGSLLTAAKMTQVYSNFASLMAQESGSPDPSGVWSFAAATVIDAPGSHHFGWLNVDSGLAVGGQPAKALIQSIFIQRTAADLNSTQTFSTFIVASLTPQFGDSLIKIRGILNAGAVGAVNAADIVGRANLCRAPNGTPVVLTDSSNGLSMGLFASWLGAQVNAVYGSLPFDFQETSPGSGAALQYGIRYAAFFNTFSGYVVTTRGSLLVEEWR
jgi:hypothetical protein